MNKDEIKKDEIKRGLERCSAVDFETSCSDCPYSYRCNDLSRDALDIITEQEKEIEQLTRECNQQAETLAEEQEACVECELEQSWELFVRDKEIDRLRAENERFENNMKSVLEIEKENVRKETAKSIYEKAKFVVDITRDLMHGKKYLYLGVLKEIVNRLYDVEVEE